MAEKDEKPERRKIKSFEELYMSIQETFDPLEIELLFEEALRLFLAARAYAPDMYRLIEDEQKFLDFVLWKIAEGNVLAKVLEEAIERTSGKNVILFDDYFLRSNGCEILGAALLAERYPPREIEKSILQAILRRDDGSYISWEDIEEYELILSARAPKR